MPAIPRLPNNFIPKEDKNGDNTDYRYHSRGKAKISIKRILGSTLKFDDNLFATLCYLFIAHFESNFVISSQRKLKNRRKNIFYS